MVYTSTKSDRINNTKVIWSALGLITTVIIAAYGWIYVYGQLSQQVITSSMQISSLKTHNRAILLQLHDLDKSNSVNSDKLSSLQTWTSSKVEDLANNVESQNQRLNAIDISISNDRRFLLNFFNNKTSMESKNG